MGRAARVTASLVLAVAAFGHPALVLVGPSGSGKSETGNTLVGDERFRVSEGLESETRVPSGALATIANRTWQVIDTPGSFDTTLTADEQNDLLAQFAEVVEGHIAALVFVVPYGRFGDAHLRAWRITRGAFGPSALNYTVLAFTSCKNKTGDDLRKEVAQLCASGSKPALCTVIDEVDPNRIVAFGKLEPERRERDRLSLVEVADEIDRATMGIRYDPGDFLRMRRRRRLLARRVAGLVSEDDRRVLELLLANVEAGSSSDDELLRALEAVEGMGATEMVRSDFEDRSLSPFRQVGTGWRQPIAVPYTTMRGSSTAGNTGGRFFLHSGSDSGVRLRRGDERTGEFRTSPFFLGDGDITWEGTGNGGALAVCRLDGDNCLERRFRRESMVLVPYSFSYEELVALRGAVVYLRLVDDRKKDWGFIALDNLEYPVLTIGNLTAESVTTTTAAQTLTTTTTSAPQSHSVNESSA